MFFINRTPGAALMCQQVCGCPGSPRTCRVVRERAWRQGLPYVQDRRNDRPASLDHIGTLKQRGVPDHAVVEQAFVAGAGLAAEVIHIIEIHLDGPLLHDRSRNLGAKLQGDAFIVRDRDYQLISLLALASSVAEQDERVAM